MERGDEVLVFSGDAVVTVAGSPLREASVAVAGGVIAGVGGRDEILAAYSGAEEHRWAGVIVPGLINAHTHLQFTGFAQLGRQLHEGFEQWSVAFDRLYAARSATEDWRGQATEGARQAIRAGTTTVADVCTDLPARHALVDTGLAGYAFIEALGYDWEAWTAGGERDRFLASLDEASTLPDGPVRIGVCAHAPYSLDTPVLSDVAAIARSRGLRLHTHIAESEFEDAYYRTATGPLADFVEGFGRRFEILARNGVGRSATEFASDTTLLGVDSHVAHGIYVDAADRALLRATGTPIALCPRSNATIGLGEAPVAAYLQEGNRVCVGTDSLSSSPSLDLLEDVRLLRDLARDQGYDHPDLEHRLVHAATLGGAHALGMDRGPGAVGSIEVGKRADLAVFEIDHEGDPARNLVADGPGRCVATVVAGAVYDHVAAADGDVAAR